MPPRARTWNARSPNSRGWRRWPRLPRRPSLRPSGWHKPSAFAGLDCVRNERKLHLLKEVFEGTPGVFRAYAAAGGFPFHRHFQCEKRAVVGGILASDAGGNGLAAFESRGGIEVRALLAGVQCRAALGTASRGIRHGGQYGAALGAARNRARSGHVERPRAKRFRPWFGACLPARLLAAAVHVAALPVLAIGHG